MANTCRGAEEEGGERAEIRSGFVGGRTDWSNQPHEPAVRAVKTGRVEHQERLVRILICDDATATLIPVENDLAIQAFLDDELVDGDGAAIRLQVADARFDGMPSGTGQTVLRRVNGVALALRRVVADVDADLVTIRFARSPG